jgi:hypothetical protein
MFELAAALAEWARLAVPVLGVTGFAGVATFREQRPTRGASLVVLAPLLGIWLFFGTLFGTEFLALVLAAVLALAIALRSFSAARSVGGGASTAVAFGLFVAWIAGVHDSVVPGATAVPFALAALAADARRAPRPDPPGRWLAALAR